MTITEDDRSAGSVRTAEADPRWHLNGNFAPVIDELDVGDLEVEGAIPEGLNGLYLRNGFNPVNGESDHWFFGHGMIHAIDLDEGRASYRNRYVRTPYFEAGGTSVSLAPVASPANTHVVAHAGRILALEEVHYPWEIDAQLNTVGVQTFGDRLAGAFTACLLFTS